MGREQKFYFLPVLVHKNPSAMVYHNEFCIHYPWLTDRCGEHWAIVQRDRVFLVPVDERGDELNRLQPAFIAVEPFKVEGGLGGRLGDLDGKYIVRPRDDFFHLTMEELDKKRYGADAGWVEAVFGRGRQENDAGEPAGGQVVLDLRSGLLERRDS